MREKIVNRRKEIIMIALMFIGSIMIWNGLKVEWTNVLNRCTCHTITISDINEDGVVEMKKTEDVGIDGRRPFTWDLEEMKEAAIEIVAGLAMFTIGYGCTTRKIEILKVTRKEAK